LQPGWSLPAGAGHHAGTMGQHHRNLQLGKELVRSKIFRFKLKEAGFNALQKMKHRKDACK